MSGYRHQPFGGGSTGPLQTNHQVQKLVHKFKHCNYCSKDKDQGGGVQRSATKWACAGCWRLLRQGSSVKKDIVSYSPV